MADYDNVYIAVRNLLVNNAGVSAVLGARIYSLWRTGTNSTYPRLDFGMISHNVNDNGIHETFWQFSFFDDDADVNNCHNLSMLVEKVLDWTNFSVTGWQCHWCEKVASRVVGVGQDRIAHVADDYVIRLRPTA